MYETDWIALAIMIALKVAEFVYRDTQPTDRHIVPDWRNWDGEE